MLFNDQTGHFGAPVVIGDVGVTTVAVGDLNRDGRADIVTARPNDSMQVYLSQGQTFRPGVDYDTALTTLDSLFLGDFNGDGYLDVLVTETASSDNEDVLSLRLNDSLGGLEPVTLLRSVSGGFALTGDFDGDGHLDLYDTGFVRFGSCGLERRRAARH